MTDVSKIHDDNDKAAAWAETEMTFAALAAQKHIPLGGTFELTPRCNFRCKMCYVRLDRAQMDLQGRELTAGEWINLGKEAIKAGTLNLLITGGEPLLRDDFGEIYTALTKMGFIITLNTNASLMNDDLLKLFRKYPPTATNVTLYGSSVDTYAKLCGSGDGFEKTVRGLEMLSSISTALEVRTTFVKDNVNELESIRALANKYTKRFAINVSVFKAVRGAVSDVEGCRLSPEEVYSVSEKNLLYYMDINRESVEKRPNTEQTETDTGFNYDLPPKIITCLAAKSAYWITWDGKMLPCGSFSHPYTLPLQEGFVSAWKRLPELYEDITRPAKCNSCEYADGGCANCPAMLQSETGSFTEVCDYICDITKERARRKQKYLDNI